MPRQRQDLQLNKLRKGDLLKLLECITELQEHGEPATLPRRLLDTLAKLLPAEIVGYNEMDVAAGKGIAYECNIGNPPHLMEALQRNIHEHPLIQHFNTVREGQARSISEFCTQPHFRHLALYNELYRGLGVQDQIAIAMLSDTGSLIGLTANRDCWEFSSREHALLTLLRPHVGQAHRNARKIKALQEQADQCRRTLEQLPLGLAARDRSGKWVWLTDVAVQLLARYYPSWRPKPNTVPEPVNRWGAAQLTYVEKWLTPMQPLVVDGAEGRLVLSFLATANGSDLICLQEHSVAAVSTAICRLGLTEREAKVMYWVLQGKTNPQIASLLSVSPRTVQKHLEHVFQKWNVETRTLAAMYARQLLGP